MERLLWLGAGALVGSIAAISFTRCVRRTPISVLEQEDARKDVIYNMDDEILAEQFTRNIQFLGLEGQKRVHGSFVIVVGLGGVGSHAAAMLLRSGVGKIRLIDFDQVSLSSLNRHAVATRDDVGISKAACIKDHFSRIYPECNIEACTEMFDDSSANKLLSGSPDLVLDCIDNIDTKVLLIATCVKRELKILSATGAGARADPTRVRIADLSDSSVDPLSRSVKTLFNLTQTIFSLQVRLRLRRTYGIESGVPVVFSTEKPKAKLLPVNGVEGQAANPSDYQIVPGFRVRIIPVLGTIPAIFGQVMASYTITKLAGIEVQTEPVLNLDAEHYGVLHQRLVEREELLFGTADAVEVDREDVAYVVREIWHGKSAKRFGDGVERDLSRGLWRSVNKLTLTRWDMTKPPSICNLVLLTFEEAEQHELSSLEDIQANEPVYFEYVTNTLKGVKQKFLLI